MSRKSKATAPLTNRSSTTHSRCLRSTAWDWIIPTGDYLTLLIDKYAGGPVGIETLAAALTEDIGTVEEVLEPYLMQIGFLKRTPRGRSATAAAFTHLGKNPNQKTAGRIVLETRPIRLMIKQLIVEFPEFPLVLRASPRPPPDCARGWILTNGKCL